MNDVKEVRDEFAYLLHEQDFVIDKSGVKTIEIPFISFIADEPSIFGTVKTDWCDREMSWYMSQSLCVHDIPPPVPSTWLRVADRDGFINSNYGWCVFSEENGNQYQHVLNELKRNPDSRRATMIYTRPSMHIDYNRNGRSDFCCTETVQYLIRDGSLQAMVKMRSSDAIFGYKGDKHWQDYVHSRLAMDLGIPRGLMVWCAGSLHVYERHFYLVQNYAETGEITIKKSDYDELYPIAD